MGEYAEQIYTGEVCESCGDYLGRAPGYSRRCAACKEESKPSAATFPPSDRWIDKPTTMKQLRTLREKKITPRCPRCGGKAKLSNTQYGVRHDCCGLSSWAWKPLISKEHAQARRRAHDAFDPLWKDGHLGRNDAYKMLAEQMGMKVKNCHMALMTMEEAERVPAAVERIKIKLRLGGSDGDG